MPTAKKIFIPILLFSFLFFIFGLVSAQTTDSNQVSISLSPEQPGPRQKTTVRLVSFAIDLDRASIVWSLNGKKALSGIGEKELSFVTGAVGNTSSVSVSIVSALLGTITKSLSVTPGEIVLIWEASDSYTPPFYKGKALPPPQGSIKIVAIPNIKSGGLLIKPENLVYQWRRNDKAIQASSGFGKNILSIKNGYTDLVENIEVTASPSDGSITAQGRVFVTLIDPEIILYENRPLEGVYYESMLPGRFTLDNEEIKINAEPYYFSSLNKEKSSLLFSWIINGKETVSDKSDPSTISLRRESGASGLSDVSLGVKNKTRILQEADTNLIVKFGTTQ
ncbi:MAG: hypothetical protein AAB507_02220 [Patescibacteria group bacterium]